MPVSTPDAAVIGAGIIGTSIAWRLAQAGCQVVVLDAGAVGGEASWAGAGMLAPGGEVERRSAFADFALESLSLYKPFVDELQRESGCAIDYQRQGAVEAAFDDAEWAGLTARAAAQREIGIASERLDRAGLRELAPLLSGDIAGALFFPADAIVDPRHVTSALALACRRRGVQIREHQRVCSLHLRGDAINIQTGVETITAARAVLAAGAWSSEIAIRRDGETVAIPPAFPLKGHLVGYALEPGSLGPIVRQGHTYLLQRANGFTIAGSSVERAGFDRHIDPAIVEDIHRRACALLPCLARADRSETWVGFRPATEALEPEIRRVEAGGLWLSYGHYRNGILLAPATAARVATEIIASLETGSSWRGESR
jgi:glycine oxidase